MKETSLDLRIAIAQQKLQGITLGATPVQVFGRIAPPSSEAPYIYFPTQSAADNSSKDHFFTENTVSIEVVVKSLDGGNYSDVEIISNEVKQRIYSLRQADYPVMTGFHIVDIQFAGDNELIDYVGNMYLLRKIIRFTINVQEL